jgi:hypothetical protein
MFGLETEIVLMTVTTPLVFILLAMYIASR